MSVYYNSNHFVNSLPSKHPRWIIYLGGRYGWVDDFITSDDPVHIGAAWTHVLVTGFERNARADRIGDAIYLVSMPRGAFVWGQA